MECFLHRASWASDRRILFPLRPEIQERTMNTKTCLTSVYLASLLMATTAATATPFFFSTGTPDGRMGTASRPASGGVFGIESADDFVLTQQTTITSASFTGLLTGGATTANIGSVSVEIYRVFPSDSNVGRTSGAPTFG